jgi:hypothetical protein
MFNPVKWFDRISCSTFHESSSRPLNGSDDALRQNSSNLEVGHRALATTAKAHPSHCALDRSVCRGLVQPSLRRSSRASEAIDGGKVEVAGTVVERALP